MSSSHDRPTPLDSSSSWQLRHAVGSCAGMDCNRESTTEPANSESGCLWDAVGCLRDAAGCFWDVMGCALLLVAGAIAAVLALLLLAVIVSTVESICRSVFRCTLRDSTIRGEPLQTERRAAGRRSLLRDLTVCVETKKKPYKITVPAGFVTDYSSIPPIGRWLIGWSKVDVAGVVHDYLYWHIEEGQRTISRSCADEVWRHVAGAGKHAANFTQRWVGWLALRLFGWWPYGRISWALDARDRCPKGGKVEEVRVNRPQQPGA